MVIAVAIFLVRTFVNSGFIFTVVKLLTLHNLFPIQETLKLMTFYSSICAAYLS